MSNACSMKYSKQVVFDAMLLLLLQKSVIDMECGRIPLPTESMPQPLERFKQ